MHARNAPANIIKLFLNVGGKELVMIEDAEWDKALHSACREGASVDVVKLLIGVAGKELVIKNDYRGITDHCIA